MEIKLLTQPDGEGLEAGPAFGKDHEFARELVLGETDAWNRFYTEFRRRLELYINRKYPAVFSEIAVEEIFDGTVKRLMEHDFRSLRQYRGECSFSTYITRATDWEIKDWLRKHSAELLNEPLDALDHEPSAFKEQEAPAYNENLEEIPAAVKELTDELRAAFLLRYYDYFGFPLREIRLLAKSRGVAIRSITEGLTRLLEPTGEDILRSQREKQRQFEQRLHKVCYEISKLDVQELKLDEAEQSGQLAALKERRTELAAKRAVALKARAGFIITTPYEVIAEILGEASVSTIRSRVFLAKKQLAKKAALKNE